jgi:hypothetical protein
MHGNTTACAPHNGQLQQTHQRLKSPLVVRNTDGHWPSYAACMACPRLQGQETRHASATVAHAITCRAAKQQMLRCCWLSMKHLQHLQQSLDVSPSPAARTGAPSAC